MKTTYSSTVEDELQLPSFFFLFSLCHPLPEPVKVHSSITQSPLSASVLRVGVRVHRSSSVRPKDHGRMLTVLSQPQGAGFVLQTSAPRCAQLVRVGCRETVRHLRLGVEQQSPGPGQGPDRARAGVCKQQPARGLVLTSPNELSAARGSSRSRPLLSSICKRGTDACTGRGAS